MGSKSSGIKGVMKSGSLGPRQEAVTDYIAVMEDEWGRVESFKIRLYAACGRDRRKRSKQYQIKRKENKCMVTEKNME